MISIHRSEKEKDSKLEKEVEKEMETWAHLTRGNSTQGGGFSLILPARNLYSLYLSAQEKEKIDTEPKYQTRFLFSSEPQKVK
jgi:hypothetical protein